MSPFLCLCVGVCIMSVSHQSYFKERVSNLLSFDKILRRYKPLIKKLKKAFIFSTQLSCLSFCLYVCVYFSLCLHQTFLRICSCDFLYYACSCITMDEKITHLKFKGNTNEVFLSFLLAGNVYNVFFNFFWVLYSYFFHSLTSIS